jgi:hypothetical protein
MSTIESSGLGQASDTELLLKSMLELVRRLEVFAGAGRRRSWRTERKVRIIAESYESGEKVSVVCKLDHEPNTRRYPHSEPHKVCGCVLYSPNCFAPWATNPCTMSAAPSGTARGDDRQYASGKDR